MRTVTSTCGITEYWSKPIDCSRKIVAALLLIFGIATNQPSWPQSDEIEESHTSEDEYPVPLSEVTLLNIIVWAAQAYVAPERLEKIVPLFVYQASEISEGHGSDKGKPELYLGVAIQTSSDGEGLRNVWRARPIEDEELTEQFLSNRRSTEHIVASIQLEDVEPTETLWVSESAWNRYVNRPQY